VFAYGDNFLIVGKQDLKPARTIVVFATLVGEGTAFRDAGFER